MNTNNSIDIADFLRQQLENQSIEPPKNIWNSVQNEIPNYPAKGISNWIWYSSFILMAGLTTMLYLFFNNVSKSHTVAKNITKTTLQFPDRAVTSFEQTNSIEQPKPNYLTLENKQKNISKSLENTTLHLEASKYSVIDKIEFLDSLNILKKVIEHPQVNEFGFYVLDISSLKAGKYNINIFSKDGKTYKRTEVLR
ncbi:MAG TPA: hypothetical protein PKG63_01245 [Bacteroidales bacterium]|jgi:hypothetical protein|nr:hypothetical protein [Bacteroidales bacterium]HNV95070.1 hypothetical protein [Bacteroidales bacterium]